MLVAVLVIHANDGLEKMEMGIHYLLTYIVLLFAGSGRISFDFLISRRSTRAKRGY
jgi:putative oxidoreductase